MRVYTLAAKQRGDLSGRYQSSCRFCQYVGIIALPGNVLLPGAVDVVCRKDNEYPPKLPYCFQIFVPMILLFHLNRISETVRLL